MVDTNNLPLSNNCNFEMYFCIESFAKKEMSQRSKRATTYFIFSSIYFLCADFCKICKRSTKQSKLLYNSLKTKSLSLALFIGFESLINSNALLKCYHSLLRTHSDQSHEIRHPIALVHFRTVFWICDRQTKMVNQRRTGWVFYQPVSKSIKLKFL